MTLYFDEERGLRQARYFARFLSWKLSRKVAPPHGNRDGLNAHWIHEPLFWADNGEPVTRKVGEA